jgi:hypothetical protein
MPYRVDYCVTIRERGKPSNAAVTNVRLATPERLLYFVIMLQQRPVSQPICSAGYSSHKIAVIVSSWSVFVCTVELM